MNAEQEAYGKYIERCLQLGASEAKVIDIQKSVVMEEWVRLKCQFGCEEYGQHLTCPPYLPDIYQCKNTIMNYHYGIILRFIPEQASNTFENYRQYKNRIRKTLARLERQLFLEGYYKAFSLHSGPCTLCEECVVQKKDISGKAEGLKCKQHKLSRPAMEAMGIDVFGTVKNVEWEPKISVSFYDIPSYYGMLLIE